MKKEKIKKIFYWITTVWLGLGMLSGGVFQVLRPQAEVDFIANLGYAEYFLIIIGVWKILGAIAILVPGYLLLKEWAYAGFFFVMSGAVFSHMAVGDPFVASIPALLTLILIVSSWSLRPAHRRIEI